MRNLVIYKQVSESSVTRTPSKQVTCVHVFTIRMAPSAILLPLGEAVVETDGSKSGGQWTGLNPHS